MQDFSIIRSPHDKKNPYVMINKNLIKDDSISPECRWLLIFLLSHGDAWEIRASYVSAHLKGHKGYGRDSIRNLFKEALEAGYMRAEEYKEGNLNRLRYFLSETPEFKKCCPRPENQGPGDKGPADQGPLISKESSYFVEDKEIHKVGSALPPVSADADALYNFFLSKIRERQPDFKEPNKDKWLKDIDLMLRKDKRDLEKTKKLIVWASEHKWWKSACLSAEKLRKSYDEMVSQMGSVEEQILIRLNRQFMLEIKEKHPDDLKALTFDDKFVYNRHAGKEVGFFLPEETFRRAFMSLFGGTYDEL